MTILSALLAAARRRRAYQDTLHALRGIPLGLAEDLNIYPGDARSLARRAVYG